MKLLPFLQAEKDAAMKQAESASRAAETFMKSGDAGAEPADLKEVKEALAKAEKEAAAAKKDRDSMKAQSESLAKEYDRWVLTLNITKNILHTCLFLVCLRRRTNSRGKSRSEAWETRKMTRGSSLSRSQTIVVSYSHRFISVLSVTLVTTQICVPPTM